MGLVSIPDEANLLMEIAEGRESAFAKIFYAYHNQLGKYVYSMVHSHDMAREIVQDVFVKIWTGREKLPEVLKFTDYLFITTRNYTLNCIRKKGNELKNSELYLLHARHEKTITESLGDWDDDKLLERAISQLPQQQQMVFLMKREGKKNVDIAQEMGITIDTVKKYRALAIRSISNFIKARATVTAFLLLYQALMKH